MPGNKWYGCATVDFTQARDHPPILEFFPNIGIIPKYWNGGSACRVKVIYI